ncbi:phytoene/squalene synthase family protein [Tropicimonas sp. IMCC34043]|uniref:phytoene/squalene synthase family protein n=1 Tax=Tropicimonas sp. IMCC34043 TaxID=2248760 RepID=UPI000E26B822|nr:phytoene/squalene synthase family protein [Tropicimonas sp. IMCC34043]
MIDPGDLDHCREAIRTGSLSFHAASKLLPRDVRDRALVLYAFCRLADDAVDLSDAKSAAVLSLHDRLDLAYAGTPKDGPADRAFAALVAEVDMPRALPEALLEGFAWDALERRYQTLDELHGYCVRVASTVGAMMCVAMGVRDRDVLARACDLGVAMQLTNIARDIGEDAEAGRLYLPCDWLAEEGIDVAAFLTAPAPSPGLRRCVKRLLNEAQRLYLRSEAGVSGLPAGCRMGIFAARQIYARIGTHVAAADYDSITRRAHTSRAEKMRLLAVAAGQAGATTLAPRSPVRHAPPLPAAAFLIDAACGPAQAVGWGEGRAGTVLSVLAQLAQEDQGQTYA